MTKVQKCAALAVAAVCATRWCAGASGVLLPTEGVAETTSVQVSTPAVAFSVAEGGGVSAGEVAVNETVASVFRNTVVTNGNLTVEIRITLVTNVYDKIVLTENLPKPVASTSVELEGATELYGGQFSGQTYKWSFTPSNGVRSVCLRYAVMGLTSRSGLSGDLKWYDVAGGAACELSVLPGTHASSDVTVPPSAYEVWASDFGDSVKDVPSGDADGDGLSNYEEFLADTAPNERASVFRLTGAQAFANGVIRLHWSAGAAATLSVEWKPSLSAEWRPLGVVSGGRLATDPLYGDFALPLENGKLPASAFFRLRASRPSD